MEQKIIFISGQSSVNSEPDLTEVKNALGKGYVIKGVFPQHLAGKGDSTYVEYGGWLCILEKSEKLDLTL